MADVKIENLVKSFGPVDVLKDINLEVIEGSFVVLVGPSGCGKSTLLRSIAGLESINGGTIIINGRNVSNLTPAQREIAMVFQSYALYPHMNVEANMGFGLKFAGTPREEIANRVAEASRILQLEPLLKRKPKQLSGGQRQRVAIGRAIVRKPKVFLFDEPLSNLDAALRVNTRLEIAKLHKLLKATIIYVTHDQVEAMTLADKIVVMNQGRIEQSGKPLDLYYKPANLFVARFIGSPAMNILNGTISASGNIQLGDHQSLALPFTASLTAGTPLNIGIRPEHITLVSSSTEGSIKGRIEIVERLGEIGYAHITLADMRTIIVEVRGTQNLRMNDAVYLKFAPQHLHFFTESGTRLTEHE